MRVRFFTGLTVVALSLLGAGCGGKNKPVKVEGTVVDEAGKAVPGVTVRFVPVDAGSGSPASGLTGDDGAFKLTTTTTGDGARPGDYKVVIEKHKTVKLDAAPVAGDPESMMKAMKEAQKQAGKKPQMGGAGDFHANYADEAKTPLRQKVPPDGKVEIKLSKSGT